MNEFQTKSIYKVERCPTCGADSEPSAVMKEIAALKMMVNERTFQVTKALARIEAALASEPVAEREPHS